MRTLFFIFAILLCYTVHAQRVRQIDTDTVVYYIDTETNETTWGGAEYTGNQHIGTNTGAYSQTDGYQNTKAIVAALGAGNYPAYRCDTLHLNGKDEWYLPAGDESKIIYQVFNASGLFAQGWYWTSTDHDNKPYNDFWTFDAWAWKKWFGGGEGDIYEKGLKIDINRSFCILKETKVILGIPESPNTSSDTFRWIDVMGRETEPQPGKVLIKKFRSGRTEKVVYLP
ncbi:hypothetical protein [Chryseolinea soli]|uniref:DUF1566 domain-containing protein n=1 Tax=Chryseolinea soli TaxID=2321403 RepID=A0A385SJ40_9BACT|nr:hypothetical protein [Chryseolinea soli]AYB29945.1 hypothetical protein D4L85_04835 [Chryseolinea soli]